jgi:hypothetical protein
MQNSAAGLLYFIDAMADIEVWEVGKPYLVDGY